MTKRALLIGAGFSYDLGMPLAKGLTKDFFHFLTPSYMQKCINIWKKTEPYGQDNPIDPKIFDKAYDIFIQYRNNVSDYNNYEDFLKKIQNLERKSKQNDQRRSFRYLFSCLFDLIHEMFWMYQYYNFHIFIENSKFYDSFVELVKDEELWVLSLNHDLIIEFLCFKNKIPISFGANDNISLPKSNHTSKEVIYFYKQLRENVSIDKMVFYRDEPGVNLIKLHGAINEFSFYDDKELLYIKPEKKETPVSYLGKVDIVLHDMSYYIQDTRIRLSKEIAVSDFEGEMQLLRKSVLTGGYKYSETFKLQPGEEKLKLLEEVLAVVDEVVVIGYGFADEHINSRLYNAMLLNKNLIIWCIDPNRIQTPECLRYFDADLRVRRVMSGAAEWLSYHALGNQWDSEQIEELKEYRTQRVLLDKEFQE